jgi:Holliday junction resolvase
VNEAGLQRKVIQHLKQNNIWHVKTKESNRSGIPDLIGCKSGKFFAIELKSPDNYNKATKLQEYEIYRIKQSGGITLVSRDFDEVVQFIQGI